MDGAQDVRRTDLGRDAHRTTRTARELTPRRPFPHRSHRVVSHGDRVAVRHNPPAWKRLAMTYLKSTVDCLVPRGARAGTGPVTPWKPPPSDSARTSRVA
ncbi:hypothetical protein BC739_003970 [Kutzneria viridogrisea]|uniref:Uncharacterized protein n=1 Tax=Kutzneria viridogrisea TaxID=47990 RepID=A0ABR6BIQ6_9PSEU|nr:hypothetical protein [Kutzneria viridogrisea]